ncbi:lytic murein transglycosylase B [Undibacterium sp. FT147W]|uniref:Lytic murein transglycosylase B n=1 Tax=Undibacterium rivi TaxID=2828729 RepID=A0ABS5H3K7_9BURK|nr:lytic murein transglycosylase B [Undibacterium rivi]MBR7792932.1 lytic murein transglycosylase B [Undibacterium rivi]
MVKSIQYLVRSCFCAALVGSIALPAFSATSSTNKAPVKRSNLTTSATPVTQENVRFNEWKEVSAFITEMVDKHQFDKVQLQTVFEQVRYVESARQLMKPAPPGKPKNWKAYRARFVEPYRIEAGVAFWNKYADALERARQQYGVPPEIIVGLIGVETIFGKNTGKFRVMDALTTLAFDYPDTPTRDARMQYFRNELENMLLMARESGVDPFAFKGSYAGAIGWPQFMPGSIRKFAVDFDGDGSINLTDSPIDAIGSVAHYLAMHGWKRNLPVTFPATLISSEANPALLQTALSQGLRASYSLAELKTFISTASSDAPSNIQYGVIDLQNGDEATEYWLATDNFFAITQYNRSYFYAMSVFDLGRIISAAKEK